MLFLSVDYTSSTTKVIHICMWPTGDSFFFMESRLCFSCAFLSQSTAQSLINRKEERAGAKESSAESLRMMMPSRREAHSSLFLHHLPAIQHEPATLGSPEAGSVPACGRTDGRERSERGQVENERERDFQCTTSRAMDLPFCDNAHFLRHSSCR